MRVAIDWHLCIGSGLCVAASPDVFAVVERLEGERAILLNPDAPVDALRSAATACPMLAIRLFDDSGAQSFPPLPGEGSAEGNDDERDQTT